MIGTRIVIFAKAPVPGKVKTRLIPALGPEGAAALAAEMLARTALEARAADVGPVELCADPDPDDGAWSDHLPDRVRLSAQGDGDLGARMARAAQRTIEGGERVLLIGTDCPGLDRRRLREAAAFLDRAAAVIHPTQDGGYALLGLRRFESSLFSNIAWSTPSVAAATLARLDALGWPRHIGETLRDIDEPADLAAGSMPGDSWTAPSERLIPSDRESL